jgi:hypothetical protein
MACREMHDEEGFTRDDIVNFHNTHVWVDNNPPTSPRHQNIMIDFPSMSGWAPQAVNTYDQLSYLTD